MTPPPAVRDDPLWQVGVSLMSGGSLCKVGVVEFPAGINSKLLFVIVTMLNTIHDTLMPAENCTGQRQMWQSGSNLEQSGKVVQIGDVRKWHQGTAVAEKQEGSKQNTDTLDKNSPTSLVVDFSPPNAS